MANKTLALLAAALIALTGCGDDDASTGPSGDARVTLQLADAPGDLQHAWVEISRIYLVGQSEGEDGQGVVLMEGSSGLVDLLTLANTTAELVRDIPVPAGTYSQLRLVVNQGIVETEDGRVFATSGAEHPGGKQITDRLQCPSCAQSGLKIKLPGGSVTIEAETKILVLDFDVRESFGHEAGKSGKWVMHPVIHASELQASGTISGAITLADGVVVPACGGEARDLSLFVPQAANADGALHSGNHQDEAHYRIAYLAPGVYDMGYAAAVEFDTEALEFTAELDAGQATIASGGSMSVGYTVTAVECVPR